MSAQTWQQLFDRLVLQPKNASHGVIYDLKSHVLLAHSPGYWLPKEDVLQCIDALSNPEKYLVEDITLFKSCKLDMPMEFLVVKADQYSWYGKRGATSCFCSRTKDVLIVLFTEPPIFPGKTANAIEKLVDLLDNNNK